MALFGRPTPQDDDRAQAYGQWLRQRHPYSIASCVLGVFSLIEMGVLIVFGVAGIALGVMALRQLGATDSAYTSGRGLAWAGIITSAVSLCIAIPLYAMRFNR